MTILTQAGFRCIQPRGAYYIMTDVSGFGFPDDVALARHLVTEVGVASVPGSSFYRPGLVVGASSCASASARGTRRLRRRQRG